MKILVLGSGMMGPAAAIHCLSDADVTHVTLADRSAAQLEEARASLVRARAPARYDLIELDLADPACAARFAEYDAIIGCIPWKATIHAIRHALAAGRPLIDMAVPDFDAWDELSADVAKANGQIILGAGLEPGMSDIFVRWMAAKMDRGDALSILCGGVPESPRPPLDYMVVFGGRELWLRDTDVLVIEDGKDRWVRRFSDPEAVWFEDIGELEAWQEGIFPWVREVPQLRHLQFGEQKTIRWPGYSEKITALLDFGLLGTEPIEVNGQQVVPKQVVDAVLGPKLRRREGEVDLTLFRILLDGEKDGEPISLELEMVDRMDEERGITSMARTTSFTAATIALMAARGEIAARGLLSPDGAITGPMVEDLFRKLGEADIHFTLTENRMRHLG